jgi:hypothetical protein
VESTQQLVALLRRRGTDLPGVEAKAKAVAGGDPEVPACDPERLQQRNRPAWSRRVARLRPAPGFDPRKAPNREVAMIDLPGRSLSRLLRSRESVRVRMPTRVGRRPSQARRCGAYAVAAGVQSAVGKFRKRANTSGLLGVRQGPVPCSTGCPACKLHAWLLSRSATFPMTSDRRWPSKRQLADSPCRPFS